MALAQHTSKQVRFQQQVDNAETFLVPFIEQQVAITDSLSIMEIGCGEGGVLRAFTNRGASCLGVDLSPSRIEAAKRLMEPERAKGLVSFLAKNVYDEDFLEEYRHQFDLILLKDTIEHIPEQEKFIPYLHNFLTPNGHIFFGFPPWRMPFGGHQQICKSKILSVWPWIHLLPRPLYAGSLRLFGESDRIVEDLIEIKDTGITTHRFERIIRQSGFQIQQQRMFLFNPIYRYKFGLTPRDQAKWVLAIPHLRDFVTTAGWYLVGKS
ncbi:MAG: class I SAM-dependent methyltransferase [Bacteroidota bacterium]